MQRVSNADFITTPKLDIGIILVLNIWHKHKVDIQHFQESD